MPLLRPKSLSLQGVKQSLIAQAATHRRKFLTALVMLNLHLFVEIFDFVTNWVLAEWHLFVEIFDFVTNWVLSRVVSASNKLPLIPIISQMKTSTYQLPRVLVF